MFSEAVDDVARRSRRFSQLADIGDYLNATVRECARLSLFSHDLVEDTLVVDAVPFVWQRPLNLIGMRAVKYADGSYPDFLRPGRILTDRQRYFYSASTYFVFAGAESGSSISVAYYTYPKRLQYYAIAERPATFDFFTEEWTYLTPPADEAAELIAQAKVSNWLLLRHYEAMKEGTLAKLFKSVGDERAGSTFALYKSMQGDIKTAEGMEAFQASQSAGRGIATQEGPLSDDG